jgi:hypothetical protein
MANEPGGGGGARGPGAGKELPQHPLVESLRPDPSQPAKKTVVLIGLPGKSDRPGYQRLYLTTKLNYYAEFLVSGILNSETIAADKSPFPGHEATQVTVGRDANIQYITATSPQPVDEFDLDVRLGAPMATKDACVQTHGQLTCRQDQPFGCTDTCPTQPPTGCDNTACGNTCVGATCPVTQCGNTCVGATCPVTQCGNTCVGATCPGAATCCGTCVTCPEIRTCAQTCRA